MNDDWMNICFMQIGDQISATERHSLTQNQPYLKILKRLILKGNTTGATNGTGFAYPSGVPEFTSVFSGISVARCFLSCIIQIVVCPFLLTIVLSILRGFMDICYSFGIFKLKDLSCICVLVVSILPLSTILIQDLGTVPTVVFFCLSFHHFSPLIIISGVRDMRKSPYGSHISDPVYHPIKMAMMRP